MTDLIWRLRNPTLIALTVIEVQKSGGSFPILPEGSVRSDMEMAADEIEGLRASLRAAQQHNMDMAEDLRKISASIELPAANLPSFADIKQAIKGGNANVK